MKSTDLYDVIIIGGSYAGLSAAMSLGRSLRKVLVIDSGNPCNKQTPFAHNFLTNDGINPHELRNTSKTQIAEYKTVELINGLTVDAIPLENSFEVITEIGQKYTSKKLLFATGVTDTLPHIQGFSECWGISVLHCPYCHGYEVKSLKTGVLGNGDMGFELAKVISHWTDDLTLYTNGTSTLTPDEVLKLNKHNIKVVENEIDYIEHENGQIKQLHFKDTTSEEMAALYTQLPFIQQCPIPEKLGCDLTEKGFIFVNKCMESTVNGVFGAGDCLSLFRSIAHAVAQGNKAGAIINKCLIEEEF
ncbi:pyridine nucleotide-disulfide oxidoreductase [Flavobacterium psychrophilum]|nr:pyridine nucleotide-disulfide oxidoreductase [Flavobacterium psychrophilum]AOE53990.1 pyridine nucleotide-disulfide oxidoreductase [Flavobacterium psychrophilum]